MARSKFTPVCADIHIRATEGNVTCMQVIRKIVKSLMPEKYILLTALGIDQDGGFGVKSIIQPARSRHSERRLKFFNLKGVRNLALAAIVTAASLQAGE